MTTIIENLETKKIECYTSQVSVAMLTGIPVTEQVPGREGNGYRIINMYFPVYPKLARRASLEA